jgi:hypothetical protein
VYQAEREPHQTGIVILSEVTRTLASYAVEGPVVAVVFVFAVAFQVERGFSPALNPPRSGYHSAKGRSEARRANRDPLLILS